MVSIQFIRIILGLLSLFFAYFLGRVAIEVRRRKLPHTKLTTWVLRTAVCLFGVVWRRGLDATSIVFLVLAAASFAAGLYLEWRPRRIEEIHLFPNNKQ